MKDIEIVIDSAIDLFNDDIYETCKVAPVYLVNEKTNEKIAINKKNKFLLYKDENLQKILKEGKLGTSATSISDFKKIIESSSKENVVIFTISSKLSAIYNNAKASAKEISEKNVYVVDTKAVSYISGIVVEEFVNEYKKSRDLNKSIEKVSTIPNIIENEVYIKDINYLFKSGRLNPIKYAFLKVSGLYPKLKIEDGELKVLGLVRDIERELEEKIYKFKDNKYFSIVHTCLEDPKIYKKSFRANSIIACRVGFDCFLWLYLKE